MSDEVYDLEDLIKETEDKILNNNYYEDTIVEYKGKNIGVRIRPMSQVKFTQITRDRKILETAEFNTRVLQECIINKYDNKPFTRKQIEELFTGGLATVLTLKSLEVSGLDLDANGVDKLKKP